MKRYLLFAFDDYEERGGMCDFIRSYDDLTELIQSIKIGKQYTGDDDLYFDIGMMSRSRDGLSIRWYENVQIFDTVTGALTVGSKGVFTHKELEEKIGEIK